jgi:PAS domain S-box-containing protein
MIAQQGDSMVQPSGFLENQALFRTMIDSATEAIFILDLQNVFMYANRAAYEVFGMDYEKQDLIGFPAERVWLKEDLSILRETVVPQAMAGGWTGDVKNVRADGTIFDVQASAFAMRDVQGQLVGMWVTLRDITARKQAEAQARLNEVRMNASLALTQMVSATLPEITLFALESGVEITDSKIGYLAFMNADESVLTMYAWSKSAMAECGVIDKPIEYPIEKTGLWGEAVRQRKPVITNDYAAPNPLKKGHPTGHVQVDRHMNIPVFDGEHIVAVAGVGNKVGEYDENDVRQLTLLMNSMWQIIKRQQTEAETRRLQEQIIEAQRHALQELSTPIIPVLDRIIVMPLIGSIDTMRAKDITRALLAGITRYQAKIVIVDITGVPLVDSGVADHLNKTIQAARLKGAQTIVTGISDAVAEAIIDLGIDWSKIQTLSDLQTGLMVALQTLQLRLVRQVESDQKNIKQF